MIERIDPEACRACGRCVEVCPMDVFRLDSASGRPVARYPSDCQTCFNCELECPVGAIRISPFKKRRPQAWAYFRGFTPPAGDETPRA